MIQPSARAASRAASACTIAVAVAGVVATILWLAGSAGFSLYVSNFGSYNKTYGALGGFVALLVWMWISNLALLFGLELNTEIQRNRQFEQGMARAEREIQMKPRAEPAPRKTV